jgi:transposase-like protein
LDSRPIAATPRPDPGDRGRFSAQRKAEAVLRLLRGEDLETLSRSLGVTAARLAAWRNDFLDAGAAALKTRHESDDPRQEEVTRLKAKIGDLTMANELLETKILRLEAGLPLARRRSRP